MLKKILPALLITTLFACAAPQKNAQYAKLSKDKTMVCEHSASTGSHMKKRKCMSKKLADEIRRKEQNALRSQEYKGQTSTSGQ